MKFNYFLLFGCLVGLCCSVSHAMEGMLATPETITQLKKDLREGHIRIGQTRLRDVLHTYGKAVSITDDDRRIIFDYDDIRVEFIKRRLWRDWSYDGFRKPVYTDDVDDLRFDLESEELVGNNITADMILKDYGEPTDSKISDVDGQNTVYFYGDIKLIFENVFVLRSWRAQNIAEDASSGVLTGN